MANEADMASVVIEAEEARRWVDAQNRAAAILKGQPGDCVECGRTNLPRVVNDHCGRCRDELKQLGVEV